MIRFPARLSAHSERTANIPVLDGLRGIAILWVLAFHLSWLTAIQWHVSFGGQAFDLTYLLRTGFLGVELFFFISGFCIFYPYAQHAFGFRPYQTLGDFAFRRAIKIVPSYLLSLLFVAALAPVLFFPSQNLAWQLISHVLFIFNFSAATVSALNGVLWSLAIEVQFYLLFPLLCRAFQRSAIVTFTGLSAIAIVYRFWSTACCDSTSIVHYQLPAFLDFFACGMLGAQIYCYGISRRFSEDVRSMRWWTVAAVASLIALTAFVRYVLWGFYLQNPNGVDRADILFYLGVGFLVLTITTAFAGRTWQSLLSNKPLVFMSVISYNLYLYHLIVSMSLLYRLHFPASKARIPQTDPHWQISFLVIAAAVSITVATIVTYAIERPLLRHGRQLLSQGMKRVARWMSGLAKSWPTGPSVPRGTQSA